ncbi:unnamed protein product [Phytophthora fragariaefolia]|uniref:Unnamed protein product n=1 Tax=Phytophthora fragariaefolia TaxID=1490495 RepID=A0A9W6XLC5_9STRA|nr:unnamed protein product [Phytophthora fragariaefolia]
MLQAQTNINRELAMEIEELTTSKISSSNQLQRRMKDLELICEERQQRIHTLQAEIRQLKYAREKMLLKIRESEEVCSDDSASDDEESEVASLSESLILASRDLSPGEQLLELGIVSGSFDSSVIGINSSTFVLCDFYDFESQSTPLLMGNRPEYNLSATFKVTVDGFFLRYLASESIILEVHQAARGDFKLIGKASIRLSKLLQSKGVVKEPSLPVKSVCCGKDVGSSVLGTLSIILRLSTPISEIWQVHLRSYPQDIMLLSSAGNKKPDSLIDVLCNEDFNDTASHSLNELQVTVFACRKLRSYGKRSDGSTSRVPSSYVHYQLLGFPDIFTNIVPESSNPEYDLSCSRRTFTLEVDACLLRFFSKFHFWITVFDDQVDLGDNTQENGVVGRCGILLSELVNGEDIRGWFPLKDENDQYAGDISILIQWKDPFQVLQLSSSQRARGVNGRQIDVYSLDFDQQHALLSMFSSDRDGRVNYRQFLHYAAPSEELELLTAKLRERLENAIDRDLVMSVEDAFTAGTGPRQQRRMNISMNDLTKAGEKYGIFLSDSERELLLATFGTRESFAEIKLSEGDITSVLEEGSRTISLNYLIPHINPRLSCGERLLCHKIRQTIRRHTQEQKKRKAADSVIALNIFSKFDDEGCGRITRSAFRKCMSALGFELMNVESEYRELVRNHLHPKSNDIECDSIVKDASPLHRGSIDLDEEVLDDVATKTKIQLDQPEQRRNEMGKQGGPVETQTSNTLELSSSSVSAATEFQRRKQAFMDRMKAIASTSSKNLVYEQVEKKLHDQRLQVNEKEAKVLSQQKLAQHELGQLHARPITRHDERQREQLKDKEAKALSQQQLHQHQLRHLQSRQHVRHSEGRRGSIKEEANATSKQEQQNLVHQNDIQQVPVKDKAIYQQELCQKHRAQLPVRQIDSVQTSLTTDVKPDYHPPSENDTRLRCVLDEAVKHSLQKFQKCLAQFQEFCVLHNFSEVPPATLWRQMESNGLVELLSKRGVGLLSRKFSFTWHDENDSGGESNLRVSLEAIHTYLKTYLSSVPVIGSPKHKLTVPSEIGIQPKSGRTSPKSTCSHPGRTPITVLSDFLDWCEERGVDLRGELEARDTTYTGFVTAMELKDTLLRLGFAKVALPSPAEAVVGQLVRQYRCAERTDAVQYTAMLYEITKPISIDFDSRCDGQVTEHLRSRIRSKAGLLGKINHADTTNYAKLDAAFNHFDREKKGFLTPEHFYSGLKALTYDVTPKQLDQLVAQICVFRHSGGGLSRTEFDSFVLDPYCSRLLLKLANELYSEVEPHSQDTMPRVAYLSRLLMECGGASKQTRLPQESFWTQLERALERQVTLWERLRLQHLFDVKRDGRIAYQLFLKVMSQWRVPITVKDTTALTPNSKMAEAKQEANEGRESHRLENENISNNPPYECGDILRSLYNRMSSIDFESQVDIVEEYLRLKDTKNTGSIKMKQLKRVFDQIGLSLSPGAFTSLQMYFPGIASPSTNEEQVQLLAYGKLILALEAMHEQFSAKT